MSIPTQKFRFPILMVLLLLSLTGCFRDAGNGNAKPTKVTVSELRPQVTPPTQTKLPPTFTPKAAEVQPTKTLSAGGPPVGEASSSPNPTVAPEDATLAPPGLGETGMSATPETTSEDLATLQATPTSFAEPDECIYQVQGGDTLYSIATSFGLFPEDFYAVNPELAQNPNNLSIGQEIQIPDCESDSTATTTAPETTTQATAPAGTALPQGVQSYTVQEGDTLYGIALKFGVTVQAIVDATDFLVNENTIIRPGDVLMIPAP